MRFHGSVETCDLLPVGVRVWVSGFQMLLLKLVILQKAAPYCSTRSTLSLVSEDNLFSF